VSACWSSNGMQAAEAAVSACWSSNGITIAMSLGEKVGHYTLPNETQLLSVDTLNTH